MIEKGQFEKEKGSDLEGPKPSNGHVPNGKPKTSDGDDVVVVVDKSRLNAVPSATTATAADAVPQWRVAVRALGKLGLIMAYFYLCDRQVNNHFSFQK